MDRRRFIKTSMCLGCGAAILPASQSKLVSQLAANFSRDRFVYKRKEDMPKKIRLEACSLCQLNCPGCNSRFSEQTIKEKDGFGYLKFEDFKNLVDDNHQIEEICLSHAGEMFLNPELDKIIEYAYKKNIKLTGYTGVNLNTLSDEMAECLVANEYNDLTISLDGATPETYAIYRRGGDFNKVIENIKKLNKYKEKYNSIFPILTWKFILFGHNEHEIELAKQKAKELNMDILFSENSYKGYSPLKNKEKTYKAAGLNIALDYGNPVNNKKLEIKNSICYFLFEAPTINWNGNLLGCCANYDKSFDVNAFKLGLMNALNHEAFIEAKHLLTNKLCRDSIKTSKQTAIPCLTCFYYKDFLKKNNLILS